MYIIFYSYIYILYIYIYFIIYIYIYNIYIYIYIYSLSHLSFQLGSKMKCHSTNILTIKSVRQQSWKLFGTYFTTQELIDYL